MQKVIATVVILFAATLAAQPLTVGTQIVDAGGTATFTSGGPVTYVNLTGGATAAGTVDKASVAWSKTCSNAFKIVFLRQNLGSLAAFSLVASRGPFNAVNVNNASGHYKPGFISLNAARQRLASCPKTCSTPIFRGSIHGSHT